MSKAVAIDLIVDTILVITLILNGLYVKQLEDDIDALKSWIEFFWKVDLGAMADAVDKHRKEHSRETDRR